METTDVVITQNVLDIAAIHLLIQDEDCGAQLVFVGRTRKTTGQLITASLSYQAYHPMAEIQLERLAQDAIDKWGLRKVVIHHRIGSVEVGEASIVVAAASPHRVAAFTAVAWLMDQIKCQVPIWKQETYEDSSTSWIHPQTG